MKLYIDDTRALPDTDTNCICVRNSDDAIRNLSLRKFDYISLDFDLGMTSGTGLDILEWMAWRKIEIAHINIHSSHPIGIRKMLEFCKINFKNSIITTNSLY